MREPIEHDAVIDGRRVRAHDFGPGNGLPLVFHAGTPSPPVSWPDFERTVAEHGFRLVTYRRPGYRFG